MTEISAPPHFCGRPDHATWWKTYPIAETMIDAIQAGDIATVTKMLARGVNPNISSLYNWTPLYETCYGGQTAIADLLIRYGADVNWSGMDNKTPLKMAQSRGHTDIAKLLIQHGAL